MTKGTFKRALIDIDDELMLLYMPAGVAERGYRKYKNIKSVVSVAAVFLAVMLLALYVLPLINKPITEETPDTGNVQPESYEIFVGYDTALEGKETPSQHVALKCMSFYEHGEKIIIDAAYADSHYGNPENYWWTEEAKGYNVFSVYLSRNGEPIDDSPLVVNGTTNHLEKRYTNDEMTELNIGYKDIENISAYHHETIELDLSGFEVGEAGRIAFSFYRYDDENGKSYSGLRRFLYYCIGEKGIYVSFSPFEKEDNCSERYVKGHAVVEDYDNTICSEKTMFIIK